MTISIQRWDQTQSPDARTLRGRLENEGFTVSEWTDAPGTVYENHSHPDDQVHWIVSGKLDFEVNGEKYQLGPGDRDYLPANTDHAAFVPGTQPVRYLIGVKSR